MLDNPSGNGERTVSHDLRAFVSRLLQSCDVWLLAIVDNGLTGRGHIPEAVTLIYCHHVLSRLGYVFWQVNKLAD